MSSAQTRLASVPARFRSAAARAVVGRREWLRLVALDAADALRRRRDELVPPRRLQIQAGRANFEAVGESWLRLLTTRRPSTGPPAQT